MIALETDTEIGIVKERGAATGRVTDPTGVEEVIVVTGNEIETVKIVKEIDDASAMITKSPRARTVQRGGGLTKMSTKKMAAQVIVLIRLTETVLPTEDPEVGLLSIHETNSMIHPDIEEIGITVVERAGALLRMTTNIRTVVIGQGVLCLPQGTEFSYLYKHILIPLQTAFSFIRCRRRLQSR